MPNRMSDKKKVYSKKIAHGRKICADNRVKIEKSSLIPVDQDSFVVPVDVSVFEPGLLFFDIYAKVPDRVFTDGFRNEKLKVSTRYTVRP